ncbi:hypothetical protein niasHT_032893 [Heterodera trifolii]|uniref:Uncharacterized protein n=1 Tax=Heterodera trifolii TaxID=157864 RepID=A0ABD2IU92_9BILA
MSDRAKEAEEKMAKAIFISADCWLCVFDLLPPRQLGFGISMISHRFDFYVDEHFKTRKWTLAFIRIWRKIGKNGTKEMEIVNCYGKPMPMPQNPLPKKVVGFKAIYISYIDDNVVIALISHRFDYHVDEHFKTRKWALGIVLIRSGTKKMEIQISAKIF